MSDTILSVIQYFIVCITIIVAILSFVGAWKAGVLTKPRLGSFIRPTVKEREQVRLFVEPIKPSRVVLPVKPSREVLPVEIEQLDLQMAYVQTLAQFKSSFWFSLIFASVGFVAIVVSVFLHTNSPVGATVVQFFAGVIMNAVAALFFVQSKNAQKLVNDFIDKLRLDRQHDKSLELCETLENPVARDAVRIQLALHYAEIGHSSEVAKSVINYTLTSMSQKQSEENKQPTCDA